MTKEINRRIVKSTCGLCQAGRGVQIHMEGNDIVHFEGNPDSPVNKGALCAKGMASLDYRRHPDRLKYPRRRKGDKGSGQWEQVSFHARFRLYIQHVRRKYDFDSVFRTVLTTGPTMPALVWIFQIGTLIVLGRLHVDGVCRTNGIAQTATGTFIEVKNGWHCCPPS